MNLVAGALDRASGGADDNDAAANHLMVAHALRAAGHDASEDGTGRQPALVVHASQTPIVGTETAPALGRSMSLAVTMRGRDGGATLELGADVSPALHAASGGGSRQLVSVAENQRGELRTSEVSPALSTGGGKPGSGYSAVSDGDRIRRITPTERERLMGAPDGWTYPHGPSLLGTANTYPSDDRCPVDLRPDGRRESATGDGVVVQVAEWIGRRLIAVVRATRSDG